MNTDKYFRIFKINKISDISMAELKRRYRILAMKYHPDKGGNSAKFVIIQDAYNYIKPLIERYQQIENRKFFNKKFLYYGDGSIYDTEKGRWIKLKGRKINSTI
jgi:curved DNA-binding protein CbpA